MSDFDKVLEHYFPQENIQSKVRNGDVSDLEEYLLGLRQHSEIKNPRVLNEQIGMACQDLNRLSTIYQKRVFIGWGVVILSPLVYAGMNYDLQGSNAPIVVGGLMLLLSLGGIIAETKNMNRCNHVKEALEGIML
ncbi:MAG: hypothetical protein Q7R96_05730 [Nanoarchaeota archaeon]|nr:hypothetical protein [Nanoarchaeota archaeon]